MPTYAVTSTIIALLELLLLIAAFYIQKGHNEEVKQLKKDKERYRELSKEHKEKWNESENKRAYLTGELEELQSLQQWEKTREELHQWEKAINTYYKQRDMIKKTNSTIIELRNEIVTILTQEQTIKQLKQQNDGTEN